MIGIFFIFFLFVIILLFVIKKYKNENCDREGLYSVNNTHMTFPILKSNINHHNKTVRILSNISSAGLKYDAEIYNKLLNNSYICSFFNKNNIPSDEKNKNVDINIHIEKIWWDNSVLPAKQNWFVINQEFFDEPLSKLKLINKIICKTHYALNLMKNIKQKFNLNYDVIYIGHTSNGPYNLSYNYFKQKDETIFLHTAGQSPLKNTKLLIEVWNDLHKKYPFIKLYITCKKFCKIMTPLDYLKSKNGIIYNEYYDQSEFDNLRKKAICVICPSVVEGFGHYINEGRAYGCAVITTDGPPMNEFVIENKNGMLIPYKKSVNSSDIINMYTKYIHNNILDLFSIRCHDSMAFLISYNDLYNTIEKFITLDYNKKIEMCKNSRKMYEMDNLIFQNNLTQQF